MHNDEKTIQRDLSQFSPLFPIFHLHSDTKSAIKYIKQFNDWSMQTKKNTPDNFKLVVMELRVIW